MRFYVSAFGTKNYGKPLCGWRVVMRHPSHHSMGGILLAVFATAEEADAVCATLNDHDSY